MKKMKLKFKDIDKKGQEFCCIVKLGNTMIGTIYDSEVNNCFIFSLISPLSFSREQLIEIAERIKIYELKKIKKMGWT